MVDLTDKNQVIETVNQLFIDTDNRDWPRVRALFAPRVLFDMTSLAGGEPATITPQEITDAWEKGLRPLQAIHHQAGNYLVEIDENEAFVFCYGTAWHYLPNKTNRNTRVFVGSYDVHLTAVSGTWRIDRFKYNHKFIDGNPNLEAG
ncbi:MAG TPA: nuclear transport factor 2 family protein [Nitrospirota bacterium]|nr:nuclear transport factor 2 family protein [Nitrospirota bacterium]